MTPRPSPVRLLAVAVLATAAAATLAVATPAAPAYVNGDAGPASAEAAPDAYNLHLVFSAGPKNTGLAHVALRIADSHGRTVLALDDAGPLTSVRLAPGRYAVSSRHGGVERTHAIVVKPGLPVDLYLHFPADAASAGL